MYQKKLNQFSIFLLSFFWALPHFSVTQAIVEEWSIDRAQGRPMSTWNWQSLFDETSERVEVPEPWINLHADRQQFFGVHTQYEASRFDFDVLTLGLTKQSFNTSQYRKLQTSLRRPLNIPEKKISCICPTHRPHDLRFALENLHRQKGVEWELILLPNGPDYDLRAMKEVIDGFLVEHPEHLGKIQIVEVPSGTDLGSIMNIGIEKAQYAVVTKVDADDLYGPYYLLNLFREGLHITEASLYGKKCFPLFFSDLSVCYHGSLAGTMTHDVDMIAGTTQTALKESFRARPYRPILKGQDWYLCKDTQLKGGSIFSTSPFDLVVLRNPDIHHTWQIDSHLKRRFGKIGNQTHLSGLLMGADYQEIL